VATQQQNSPQEDGGFTAECQIVCGQTGEESNVDGSADYLSEDNITLP
jgi:hypothetical protein